MSTLEGKFRRDNVQRPEATRALWKSRVRWAQRHGQKPEELSFEEFVEVLSLVKPNVATGRDNVPGTILRFLPESVQNQLYRAIVDRLSGREDAHVHSWAEFDICLVPKKGDITKLSNWRPISLVPTLYKVYEMCLWKVLDKELKPLPRQLVGFRPGLQCLDIVSFFGQRPGVGGCASGKRGDNLHCGGCCEGKFGSVCEAVHGQHKKSPLQTGSGNETRRPEDSIRMEPGDGSTD